MVESTPELRGRQREDITATRTRSPRGGDQQADALQLHVGIEPVAERVAHEVDHQRGDEDGEPGEAAIHHEFSM